METLVSYHKISSEKTECKSVTDIEDAHEHWYTFHQMSHWCYGIGQGSAKVRAAHTLYSGTLIAPKEFRKSCIINLCKNRPRKGSLTDFS